MPCSVVRGNGCGTGREVQSAKRVRCFVLERGEWGCGGILELVGLLSPVLVTGGDRGFCYFSSVVGAEMQFRVCSKA